MIGVEGTSAGGWARRIAPDSRKLPISAIVQDIENDAEDIKGPKYAFQLTAYPEPMGFVHLADLETLT